MKFFTDMAKKVADTKIGAGAEAPDLRSFAKDSESYGPSALMKLMAGLFAAGAAGAWATKTISGAIAARNHAVKAARGISEINDIAHSSLTHAVKKFMFPARVYIDNSISSDPSTQNIVKSAGVSYAALIMTVLESENFVTDAVSVSDRLSSVASASLENYTDISEEITTEALSVGEAAALKYQEFQEENTQRRLKEAEQRAGAAETRAAAAQKRLDAVKTPKSLSASDVTPASPDNFPAGALYNVTLTNPTNPQATQVVPLLVQLRPFLLSTRALEAVVETASPAPFGYRVLQAKAGEIRFLKDLIGQTDRIKRMAQLRKSDDDGGFAQYMRDITKKDKFKLGSILLAGGTRRVSKNTASTIMVISQDTLDMIKSTIGVDLEKKETRDTFMKQSYTMMIYVVSQTYGKVRLYMNGIDDVGEYTLDSFASGKSGGNSDLKTLLGFISQGRAPRF